MSHNLTISCQKDNLARIRQFVSDILDGFKVQEMDAHKIVLAVDEVCANLIIHSNNCDPSHKISLSIKKADKNHIVFIIRDAGVSFDYSSYREPSLEDIVAARKKGGVGLMLVKRIMDKVEFSNDKNYNICRLTKKIIS